MCAIYFFFKKRITLNSPSLSKSDKKIRRARLKKVLLHRIWENIIFEKERKNDFFPQNFVKKMKKVRPKRIFLTSLLKNAHRGYTFLHIIKSRIRCVPSSITFFIKIDGQRWGKNLFFYHFFIDFFINKQENQQKEQKKKWKFFCTFVDFFAGAFQTATRISLNPYSI